MATMRNTRARWTVAGALVAVATAAVVGRVIAGQFVSRDPSSFQADLGTGAVTRVADIDAANGLPVRGVFARVTSGGQLCLWDAPSAASQEGQGGCNPLSDPLGGALLSASLAYEGGPAAADVGDARLIGLAAPTVASVRVLMTDGSYRVTSLRGATIQGQRYGAFGYRFRRRDLQRGVTPVAVVAFDRSGKEIDRQATGFGG